MSKLEDLIENMIRFGYGRPEALKASEELDETFFIMKTGMYSHGVMWIGKDKEEGTRVADLLASRHDDGYHDYDLMKYNYPAPFSSYDGGPRDWESGCELVHTGTNKDKQE